MNHLHNNDDFFPFLLHSSLFLLASTDIKPSTTLPFSWFSWENMASYITEYAPCLSAGKVFSMSPIIATFLPSSITVHWCFYET